MKASASPLSSLLTDGFKGNLEEELSSERNFLGICNESKRAKRAISSESSLSSVLGRKIFSIVISILLKSV